MNCGVKMKKNSLINGAAIVTISIILTKILGIIYVIPFHSIIGDEGGALYGYAYTIYLFFISVSTAGIPLAISRIVSEYQALGYYNVKKRVFFLCKKISLLLGFISFIVIILFAPLMAKLIFGNIVGGNSIKDVILVIRVIGIAVLIVPILSVYRGYFEGHRFMGPPSTSQVLEQFFRVIIIIFGSFISLKLFHGKVSYAVSIALLGASIGAFISYLYLLYIFNKNKKKFNERIRRVNEPIVSDKIIIKKIFLYSIPFIIIDVSRSLFNYIDMFTVVKGLVNYANYNISDAETIYSMLSTWCQKFNMILLAISTGIVVSMIPNLTESIVKKDSNNINKNVYLCLSILLYFTIPMTIGISFLSKSIWMLFYGKSVYGSSVLGYYIFVGLIICIFTCLMSILQTFKDFKDVFICLFCGVFVKLILNYSLLKTFYNIGLPAYYGIITSTILGFLTSIIICLLFLSKRFNIKFEKVLKVFIDVLCGSFLMLIVLFLFKLFIPVYSTNRLLNILIIVFYSTLGFLVFYGYSRISKLDKEIFGSNNLFNIIKKIIIKK